MEAVAHRGTRAGHVTALAVVRRSVVTAVRQHSGVIGSMVAISTPAPEIVLTFDDGPVPLVTEQLTAVLSDAGATATFFVLMTRAAGHGSLLEDLVRQGHEVALHGMDHRRLTGRSYGSVLDELRRGKGDLEDLTGAPVRWFRPPYGAQGPRAWLAARRNGLEPVLWNRSTRDSAHVEDAERLRAATAGASAGDILLAHDGFASLKDGVDDGPEPDVDRPDLLRRVLREYRHLGLEGRSVSDALRQGTPVRRAWFSTVL